MTTAAGAAAIDPASRLAIGQLVADHAWLIDHGQADRVAALYTEDARVLGIGPEKAEQPAIRVARHGSGA